MKKQELGKRGEKIAEEYLKQKGYRILDRNWSVRGRGGKMMGELDIVARKRRDIVFVEVKAGSSKDAAYRPEVHVTGEKIKRLKRAAQVWLSMKRKLDAPWQIDVIAVDFSAGKVPRLRHTPRAAVE